MQTFLYVLLFAAGYAACWYSKDAVTKMAIGTENFIKSLESKIKGLK